jgi:hypothetical protein
MTDEIGAVISSYFLLTGLPEQMVVNPFLNFYFLNHNPGKSAWSIKRKGENYPLGEEAQPGNNFW